MIQIFGISSQKESFRKMLEEQNIDFFQVLINVVKKFQTNDQSKLTLSYGFQTAINCMVSNNTNKVHLQSSRFISKDIRLLFSRILFSNKKLISKFFWNILPKIKSSWDSLPWSSIAYFQNFPKKKSSTPGKSHRYGPIQRHFLSYLSRHYSIESFSMEHFLISSMKNKVEKMSNTRMIRFSNGSIISSQISSMSPIIWCSSKPKKVFWTSFGGLLIKQTLIPMMRITLPLISKFLTKPNWDSSISFTMLLKRPSVKNLKPLWLSIILLRMPQSMNFMIKKENLELISQCQITFSSSKFSTSFLKIS